MSSARFAVQRQTDPLTKRIFTLVMKRGFSLKTAADLAGIQPVKWNRRAREGNWRTSEAQAIARVIGVPFHELIGLVDDGDTDLRAGAA